MVSIFLLILSLASFSEAALYYETRAILCLSYEAAQNYSFFTSDSAASQTLDLDLMKQNYGSWFPASQLLADNDKSSSCKNEVCPNLVNVYTQFFKNASTGRVYTRFVKYDPLEIYPTDDTFQIAGYLGPTPGYCGSSSGLLYEYKYQTSEDWAYGSGYDLPKFFQISNEKFLPHRVQFYQTMGYVFINNYDRQITGTPPHYYRDGAPLTEPLLYFPLQEVLQFKSPTDEKRAFLGTTASIYNFAPTTGYQYEKATIVRLIKHGRDIGTVMEFCGNLIQIWEAYNPVTKTFRLSLTKPKKSPTEQSLGLAGYTLPAATRQCGVSKEVLQYQNTKNPDQYFVVTSENDTLANSPDWKVSDRLGFIVGSDGWALPVLNVQ